MVKLKKILIGSPIHQKPQILEQFLISLSGLKKETFEASFLFIDDNCNKESSEILERYKNSFTKMEIKKSSETDIYYTDGSTHLWTENLVWKVAGFKNYIIEQALKDGYDYLFFIDSDIVLHPETIEHLIQQDKDIISEVFWTKWQPDSIELPQVWISDQYTLYKKDRNENIDEMEINKRINDFINQLRVPGVYEVGGLGACTLISKNALVKGVNFSEISNVSFWGEDRHFCIRAAALGLKLYVDTYYPAFHIYRETDLDRIQEFDKSLLPNGNEKEYNELIYVLKEGIEGLGTYIYMTGYKKDWSKYFYGSLLNDLLKDVLENQSRYEDAKLIVKAKIEEINLKIDDDNSVTFQFILINEGIEKGKSFHEQMRCEATLMKINGTWFITEFIVKE
ncbi:glycosyltransferase family 2 protein [Cytobacillus depressus]|uniref:glycosyltransferase family 2 protein n=1 Tax=Cytobacillus depressus TaxID=1602942 RepID=UPI0014788D38|nr:hypothetical protein [Cytobacillus depressus]